MQLAGTGTDDSDRAADISSHPLARQDCAIVVNATDSDRARIVRRYRLMSYQPDEFTTFAALARMKPSRGDLDPRMYKYGGLWIYPIGIFLKLASLPHWVKVTPDIAYYLDHPEAFGRFYLIARLYSVAWGLIGIATVFFLARRITGQSFTGICAAICFMLMPVVVNAAHEAKPHLAGTVLTLLAVLAGARFVESCSPRKGILVAILCGAAIGMVPSALPVVLVIPGMILLRNFAHRGNSARSRRGILAYLAIAVAVFCLTNPYVLINLLHNRAVLFSNVGNSGHFYQAAWTGAGLPNGMLLIGLGTSFLLGAAGIVGAGALGIRAWRWRDRMYDQSGGRGSGSTEPRPPVMPEVESRRRATGLLLAVATVPTGLFFLLFASRQPADYARFALPFDVFLAIEAVVAVATFVRPPLAKTICFSLLIITTGYFGMRYVAGFSADASGDTTRIVAAGEIRRHFQVDGQILATREEPAPWSLPPADLFRWKIIVPPRTLGPDAPYPAATLTIGPVDYPESRSILEWLNATPISWAGRRFSSMEATDQ